MVELDTLEQLATELGSLTWDYCVADQASSAVHKGYVTGLIEPEHLYGGDVAVYLCGPPPMVEAVRKHIDAAGVEPVGFYYERFALSGTGAAAARAEAPAEPEVLGRSPAPTAAPRWSPSAAAAVVVAAVADRPRRAARWPDRSCCPARRFRHWSGWPSRRRPALRPQRPARSPVSRSRAQEAMCR